MARIRTIKPEFFLHEGLADAEAETGLPVRLAFVGLWTICDREGRFAWRPRAIGAQLFPYHQQDMDEILSALESIGCVARYEAGGKVYGCIPSWGEHQKPNHKEAASSIPPPPEDDDPGIPGNAWVDPGLPGNARGELERKGREGKGGERARAREDSPPSASRPETSHDAARECPVVVAWKRAWEARHDSPAPLHRFDHEDAATLDAGLDEESRDALFDAMTTFLSSPQRDGQGLRDFCKVATKYLPAAIKARRRKADPKRRGEVAAVEESAVYAGEATPPDPETQARLDRFLGKAAKTEEART